MGFAWLSARATLFDAACAQQIGAGHALGCVHDVLGGALGNDVATMNAGSRSHVDNIVCCQDSIAVVLHDQDTVSKSYKVSECGEQLVVVAGVQSDARFVQNIEHPNQGRAYLRCKADSLSFAPRKRVGSAVERKVVKADVDQKSDALGDGTNQGLSDGAVLGPYVRLWNLFKQGFKSRSDAWQGQGAKLGDVHAPQAHRERFLA